MSTKIKEEIINGLDETTKELLQAISLFDQTQFNKVPFEGSWTAGQVAEHIFKSESRIPALLTGSNKPTLRAPDQNIQQIKNIFLDYTTKFKSPDFILPGNDEKDKNEFYENLKTNRAAIVQLAGTIDLAKTYDLFPLPGLGEMTGLEWLTFITCHTKRHTRQIKNIYEALNK
ncbi:MAG: DinB family protein [Ferruginibacter sp.]